MLAKRLPPSSLALGSALLFGASTPAAKMLLGHMPPVLLAAMLYIGSAIGLAACYYWQKFKLPAQKQEPIIKFADLFWLIAAVTLGGILGPILLMIGLSYSTSSSTSLLLNLETVFSALFAWFLFREHCSKRIVLGMLFVVAGGITLAVTPQMLGLFSAGTVPIILACACWALDNNVTRNLSASNPLYIAMIKGFVAGLVNYLVATILFKTPMPGFLVLVASLIVGFLGYGLSLWLFVLSLRELGTSRTSAYFSIAPFVGALLSLILLQESFSIGLVAAGILMAAGVWLHLTEQHSHEHVHEPLEHEHMHIHDEHHQHEHDFPVADGEAHSHWHKHERLVHTHPHFPDIHHRHDH